ncbi:MAG TPA: hypothetical protein VGD81_09670 [Opitutaceae bacterium]
MAATKRLEAKLARMRSGRASAKDFIIADAKDADMAFGVTAPGPDRTRGRWKTLEDYLEQIRAIVRQDIVDLMLLSASNLERLAIDEGLFGESAITPAARANDTSDIWAVRGGAYHRHPSRAFRTASIEHIKYGRLEADCSQPPRGADLGLYSITFTNDIAEDHRALTEFHAFRREAEQKRFRYFLEVFNPNVDPGLSTEEAASFLNDHIVRTLAGVTRAGRPLFLKMPYNGPGPLEELAAYDPGLVIGVLGGGAGTTLDAFQLLHDAQKHGARVALFGRKINLSEHPLTFIQFLRRIADGEVSPAEAVRAYHGELAKLGLQPLRPLEDDLRLTPVLPSYR